MELASLAALPGILQAAVADDSGRLIACAGGDAPPGTAVIVLAHATLSAADELGRRSGCGGCSELVQQHENGVVYLRSLPHRRLLLARCQSADAIPALRLASSSLNEQVAASEVGTPPAILDLSSALHAEPAW